MQALQVQATIAMDREQAQSHESKDIPTAKPLDFDVSLPDMSKVSKESGSVGTCCPNVMYCPCNKFQFAVASTGRAIQLQCGIVLQTVLGIILGGGAGSRLYPLTKKRAKPAVPLGANYRLIDIPVSNCINSNVNKIYCLTQFNSASLNRHLSQAYVSSRDPAYCSVTHSAALCPIVVLR